MIALVVLALAVLSAVVVEIVFPGKTLYHAGWYNVALGGATVVTLVAARRRFAVSAPRRRAGIVALTFGAIAAAVAGVASGLLGPDNQTVVGAPGQRVRVEGLGSLDFPLADADSAPVQLERPMRRPLQVSASGAIAGSFILHVVQRDVVYVEARDARGNRLTITQPTGAVFLSPVLLMEHRQKIAGMDLPFDSFNVPAARRVVKAVLFTPAQAAMLGRGVEPGKPAVLFAVDDENDRLIAHAIALAVDGDSVIAGGLTLRGRVGQYPAVEVMSAPNLLTVVIGAAIVALGLVLLYRSGTQTH